MRARPINRPGPRPQWRCQKSAAAARDIKGLIGDSVDTGIEQVNQAISQMDQVTHVHRPVALK